MRPQGARVTGLEPAVSVVTDGTAARLGVGGPPSWVVWFLLAGAMRSV